MYANALRRPGSSGRRAPIHKARSTPTRTRPSGLGAQVADATPTKSTDTGSSTDPEVRELRRWLDEAPENRARIGIRDDDRARRVVELYARGTITLQFSDMTYLVRQLLYGRADARDERALLSLLRSFDRPEARERLLAGAGKTRAKVRRRFHGGRRPEFDAAMDLPAPATADAGVAHVDSASFVLTPGTVDTDETVSGSRSSGIELEGGGGTTSPGFDMVGRMDFDASVTFAGGTDAEARQWRIGMIQNALSADTSARYEGQRCFSKQRVREIPQALDWSEGTPEPFYDKSAIARPSAANSKVEFRTNDNPKTNWALRDRCDWRTDRGPQWINGELQQTCGRYAFISWLVADRLDSKGELVERQYLRHAKWFVDFRSTLEPGQTTPRLTGKGVEVTAQGEGLGGVEPMFDTVNNFNAWLRLINWDCTTGADCDGC